MSGHAEERSLLPVLRKPFRLDQLLEKLAMVMQRGEKFEHVPPL